MAATKMDKKKGSSVCRVFKNTCYAVMSNYHLMSTAISLKATGLLSKVLNLPDNWFFSIKGLSSICKEKESAVETALDELKEYGYLNVTKLYPNQTVSKKIGYRYDFYEYSEQDKTVHIKPTDFVTIEKACGSNDSKVFRVTKNANYTVMSSFFLRSMNLSLKAIGLLCKVLSLPDNWDYSIDGLKAICKDGRTVIRSALKELEKWGYLKKTRLNPNETESGRFEYVYDFYEYSEIDVPQEDKATFSTGDANKSKAISKKYARQEVSSQEAESQEEEKQGVENLSIENRPQYNTKDKIQKNKISSDEISINQSLSCGKNAVGSVENSNDGLMDGYISEQAIYSEIVKDNIEFDALAEWLDDEEEAEEIVQMIVRQICSRKPYERICEQSFPREVIKSAMLKVDIYVLENAIEQIRHTDNVRNFEKYFISTLFNEANGRHFKENAEARWADYAVKRDLGRYDY